MKVAGGENFVMGLVAIGHLDARKKNTAAVNST
jgi:hypothetical protein